MFTDTSKKQDLEMLYLNHYTCKLHFFYKNCVSVPKLWTVFYQVEFAHFYCKIILLFCVDLFHHCT